MPNTGGTAIDDPGRFDTVAAAYGRAAAAVADAKAQFMSAERGTGNLLGNDQARAHYMDSFLRVTTILDRLHGSLADFSDRMGKTGQVYTGTEEQLRRGLGGAR